MKSKHAAIAAPIILALSAALHVAHAQDAKPAAKAAATASATSSAATPAKGTTKAPADLVEGMSRARLARIGPSMKEQIGKDMFPGAVTLVARHGKIVHFDVQGYQDAAKTVPLKKDALFRLALMTKPVVTVAAMMLVEQGKMRLGDPVSNWLPELKDLKVETANGDIALTRPVWVQDVCATPLVLPMRAAPSRHASRRPTKRATSSRVRPTSPATRC